MPLGADTHFHNGYVVADLPAAMRELSAALGVRFTPPQPITMQLADAQGRFSVDIEFTYSVDSPHHYELIPARAGTIYASDAGFALHHFGYWVDDLGAEIVRLEAQGLSRELWGVSGDSDEPARFAYLTNGRGVRIELVDAVLKPRMEALWAGSSW